MFKNVKKIEKIHMDSEKSINSFKIKKDRSPDYLCDNDLFQHFLNNFSSLLLCKIYIFDFFNMVDFFQIFFISGSTEILIVLNFWLIGYT